MSPFQGFMNQGYFDTQGDALGCLIAAPLGRKHKLRNIKTCASGFNPPFRRLTGSIRRSGGQCRRLLMVAAHGQLSVGGSCTIATRSTLAPRSLPSGPEPWPGLEGQTPLEWIDQYRVGRDAALFSAVPSRTGQWIRQLTISARKQGHAY